jgi:hypothetical protein
VIPAKSYLKFSGKSSLVASVTAIVEECCKSRESAHYQTDQYL